MINLTVVIDNDEAIRKLRELQNVAKTTTSSVVKDSERMDASWQQMKNTLMSLTAGVSFAALAKQVVQIRGEVQQLEVAFETMLGSKEKADVLMSQIIDLAAKTPFGLQDVSNATKMLLAYGSTAEEVTGEIKMLGNIASGLSIPLNDLIYLYGTTRTQGRMFTQDLRQFMGRGIPLAEELAKQFGVAKDKVGELVTAGKVGFDDMAKALQAMSSEGGKFNNLMDKQSATISGQISNLEDAIYQMFNEIGKSSEGVISDLISGASWVVEHYQEVLNVLKYVIAAYGSYKAALIAAAAIEHVVTMARMAKTLIDVARGAQTAAAAFTLLNSAKKGWIGVAAGIVSALAIATMDLSKSSEKAAREIGELEKAARDEHIEVNKLVFRLRDANTSEAERRKILESLRSINPKIVDGIDAESLSIETLTRNLERYNFEQTKTIQLKAINDRQNKAVEAQAQAELKLEGERLKLRKDVENIIAAYRTSGKLPKIELDINFGFVTEERKKRVQAQLREHLENAIKRRISGEIDDEGFALALQKLADNEIYRTPDTGAMPLKKAIDYDIKGIEESNSLKRIKKYTEDLADANATLKNETQNSQYLLDAFGFLEEDNEAGNSGETTATYAEAYAEAQKNYLELQRQVADAQRNKDSIDAEAYLKLVADLEEAKKEYQKYGGVTSTKGGKGASEAEERMREIAKTMQKLQRATDDAIVEAMNEGLEKKLAQIELSYKRETENIAQQEAELLAAEGKALTPEQTAMFDTLIELAAQKRDKAISATYESELAEMHNFLKEYGTFQQRKLALTEEYEQKIAKTTSKRERMKLEKERDAGLAAISAQSLEGNINWELIFGDFGNMFYEVIRPEFEKLAEYLQTDEFKNADAGDKQTLIEAYDRLYSIFGEGGDAVSFKTLGASIQKLETANANLKAKQDAYAETFQRLTEAQNAHKNALVSGSDAQIRATEAYLTLLEGQENRASGDVQKATEEKAAAEKEATEEAKKLAGAMKGTIEGLNALSGASISGVLPAIRTTAKGLEKFGGKVGDVGKEIFDGLGGKLGGILDFVFGLLDILKEGLSGLIVPIIDSIFSAVSGIIGDVLNFRDGFFRQLGEGIFKGIMGVIESIITLGGWFDWINWESDRTIEKDIQKLTSVNEALIASIDRLDATLEEERGITQQVLDNNLAMMRRTAGASSNGFWGVGGSKSSATKVTEGISSAEWEDVSELLGREINSGWEFFQLSAEELYMVAANLPVIWGKIKNLADDGYKDASQYMEAVVNNVADLDALSERIHERNTGVSYDEFRSKFKEALSDMALSAEEFSENFEKMLVGAIIESMMVEKYEERIRALYLKMSHDAEDGLTDQERQDFMDAQKAIYDDIERDRQMLADMGYGGVLGQTTTEKGFQAMSQDTGDELNGRFTDIQGKVSGIHEAVQFMKGLSSEQLHRVASIDTTVAMIHNDTTLIEKHVKELYSIREGIDRMNRNIENGLV